MTDQTDLQSIVSTLEANTTEIRREIKSAQQEIEKANADIAEGQAVQQRLNGEIASLRGQLKSLAAGREAREADRKKMEERLTSLEAALASAEDHAAGSGQQFYGEISGLKGQLDTAARREADRNKMEERLTSLEADLVSAKNRLDSGEETSLAAAKREEIARQKLEDELGRALIAARTVLDGIKDAPVRYVFANRALSAFAKDNIGPDAFRTLTDKRTISDMLAKFHEAVAGVTDRDKNEAERFELISGLLGELEAARSADTSDVISTAEKSKELMQQQKQLGEAIEGLTRAETEAERGARQKRFFSFLIPGFFLAIGAAVVAAAGVGNATEAGVLLVAGGVGIALLYGAWLNTENHRNRKLVAKQTKLKSVTDKLKVLSQHKEEHERDARALAASFSTKLAELGSTTDATRGFDELIAEAGRLKSAWVSAHSEMNGVLGPQRQASNEQKSGDDNLADQNRT